MQTTEATKMEKTYLDGVRYILENGVQKEDRTGTGTVSTFGYQARYDLSTGYFPLFTTKKVTFRLIVSELLWFIKGSTNIRFLLQHKNYIWNEWAFKKWVESDEYSGPDMTDFGRRCLIDEEFNAVYKTEMGVFCERVLNDDEFAEKYGELGEIYGQQWRRWKDSEGNDLDQLKDVIEQIKKNPDSRRLIVSAWNPESVINAGAKNSKSALPPCHCLFQFYVAEGKLSLQLFQRSADYGLGSNFNIPSYSLLLYLVANECGLEVGEFIYTLGDAHIYSNHLEQLKEQLSRELRPLPTLQFNKEKSMFDIEPDEIWVEDYNPHPAIKFPIAV